MGLQRTCNSCGFERDLDDGHPKWRCTQCEVVYPEIKDVNQRAFELRQKEKSKEIILTTETYCPSLDVTERLGIITSECVFGMNIISDALSSITDITGGRSKTTQKGLRNARSTCLNELKKEAKELGADAVIAIDLDYSEFTGGGMFGEKSMLFLVASGTAVKLKTTALKKLSSETDLNPFSIT